MPGAARQRAAALAAALLIVLALGLPWTTDTTEDIAGWMTPASCIMGADGMMSCTGGFISPGFVLGTGAASGAGTVARVFLVGALVLLVIGWRRQESKWLVAAGVGLVLCILLVGLSFQGGQVATAGAAALLLYAGLGGHALRSRASA